MLRFLSLLAGLLSAASACAQPRDAAAILRSLRDPASREVLVVAHRGDWRTAPENSLLSLEAAIALGVDVVEIDLNRSKDGVLFLLHDPTLDRTTTGHGAPADYTWAELQRLTLKNEHGGPTRQRLPSFEQFMRAAKGRVLVNLDKTYPYLQQAYEVLAQTGTVNQALFKSAVPYEKLRAENPAFPLDKVLYMPVVDLDRPGAEAMIRGYETHVKAVAYELNFPADSCLLRSAYRSIPAGGAKLWYNSLWGSLDANHDDERSVEEHQPAEGWGWLLAHGATLIQTDRPAALLTYLRQQGRHP